MHALLLLCLVVAMSSALGLKLHSYAPARTSSSEPILVLHGLLGTSRNFRTWANYLKESLTSLGSEREVICCDLRGHGKNAALGQSLSYQEMAEDIFSEMRGRGLHSAHLVGHSMGGKVAAAAALLRGHSGDLTFKSVSLLDISPVEYSAVDFDSIIRSVKSLKAINDAYVSHQDVSTLKQHIASEFPDAKMQGFMQSSITVQQGKLHWNFDISSIHDSMQHIAGFPFATKDDVEATVPTVSHDEIAGSSPSMVKSWKPYTGPVLVLKGSDSNFVQPKHSAQTSALFANHRAATMQGVGHWVHIDAPEESARKVAEFVHASAVLPLVQQALAVTGSHVES